jgi:hypothetical protein
MGPHGSPACETPRVRRDGPTAHARGVPCTAGTRSGHPWPPSKLHNSRCDVAFGSYFELLLLPCQGVLEAELKLAGGRPPSLALLKIVAMTDNKMALKDASKMREIDELATRQQSGSTSCTS